MAIQIFSARQAFDFRKKNTQSIWPRPNKGAERLLPIPLPRVSSTLKIGQYDNIFCIGSCFAREIEQALKQLGLHITSLDIKIPSETKTKLSDNAFLNKYTVHSILSELSLALESKSLDKNSCLVEVSEKVFQDYQLAGSYLSGSFEEMSSCRAAISHGFSRVRDADVVILTLGLSEVWYDRASDLYLNRAPDPKALKRHPDRFELRVLDYEETLKCLEDIHALLSRHLKSDFKILLSVSPVPLLSTFRTVDIFEANSYSKAVLRVAAEAFLTRHKNVNYFPSFEMVTIGPQDVVWGGRGDFRHVNRDFVEVIMAHALEAFLESPRDDLATRKTEAMARALLGADRPDDALVVLNRFKDNASPELNRLLKRTQSLLSKNVTQAKVKNSLVRRIEEWFAFKLMEERYFKKYRIARSAFFADSRYSLMRWWGKKNR